MKKLLLVGLLVVSSMALAEVLDPEGASKKDVLVKARVVAPLNLEKRSDVEFGIVVKGQTDKVQEKEGEVKVTGIKDENIKVFATDGSKINYVEWKDENTTYPVKLKIGEGGENKEMEANLKLALTNKGSLKGEVEGEETITIKGKVSASSTQEVGDNYQGTLSLKVMYQ